MLIVTQKCSIQKTVVNALMELCSIGKIVLRKRQNTAVNVKYSSEKQKVNIKEMKIT